MKHRYLVMWHPQLQWGAPIPTLHQSRTYVAKVTGLTVAKIRKMGWLWCKVEFDTPEPGDAVAELRRIDEMIAELQAEADARKSELTADQHDEYYRTPGVRDAPG